MRNLLLTLSISGIAVQAWQLPFFSGSLNTHAKTLNTQQAVEVATAVKTTRIAIIGAGAGGSSAAFWLSLAKERLGEEFEVDIYDKETYIGGRSTVVHPHNDQSITPEELGASIFVTVNKNIMRACQEFNLTLNSYDDETSDFGLWDGQQFLVTSQGGWWDTAKLVWRYGILSPKKATQAVSDLVDTFVKLYTPEFAHWDSLSSLVDALGFTEITSNTAAQWFDSLGIYGKFTREMIEAATRVNYAQDVTAIHGLGGAISMAANGAYQVKGGNYQIFEQFVKHSRANVHLNTTITSLSKTQISGRNSWALNMSGSESPRSYDHVILAAPYGSSGIALHGSSAFFSPVNYVHLHVTLVSTTSIRPLPRFFGTSWAPSAIPSMILTTAEGVRNGGILPTFQSISYHSTFTRDDKIEHVFKIFSLDHKDDAWLETVFGEGTLGWVYRKEWDSYPLLPPTTTFPSIKPDEGLWYVNSFEPWVSTMETETISSRNIVDQLVKETFGEGICPEKIKGAVEDQPSKGDFVYGWDC